MVSFAHCQVNNQLFNWFEIPLSGREALKRLGGKEKDVTTAAGDGSGFPEEQIVIPVGVTPQNLKNYTLYDILGFSGEWGAAADSEGV